MFIIQKYCPFITVLLSGHLSLDTKWIRDFTRFQFSYNLPNPRRMLINISGVKIHWEKSEWTELNAFRTFRKWEESTFDEVLVVPEEEGALYDLEVVAVEAAGEVEEKSLGNLPELVGT